MADTSFKDFVLDQLRLLDGIICKRMFDGYGIYYSGKFFGIINAGKLYFKTNDQSREVYKKFGMTCFQPSEKQVLKNYYEVPVDIIEDPQQLQQWAIIASTII